MAPPRPRPPNVRLLSPSSPLPRTFDGHIGVIQRNAIASWTRIKPTPEVILFGTEPGTAEAAAEYRLRHIPAVKCNEWGTPLVSDLFAQGGAGRCRHYTLLRECGHHSVRRLRRGNLSRVRLE